MEPDKTVEKVDRLMEKVDQLMGLLTAKEKERDPSLSAKLMNVCDLSRALFGRSTHAQKSKVYKIINDYGIAPCLCDCPGGPYYYFDDVDREIKRHKWEHT